VSAPWYYRYSTRSPAWADPWSFPMGVRDVDFETGTYECPSCDGAGGDCPDCEDGRRQARWGLSCISADSFLEAVDVLARRYGFTPGDRDPRGDPVPLWRFQGETVGVGDDGEDLVVPDQSTVEDVTDRARRFVVRPFRGARRPYPHEWDVEEETLRALFVRARRWEPVGPASTVDHLYTLARRSDPAGYGVDGVGVEAGPGLDEGNARRLLAYGGTLAEALDRLGIEWDELVDPPRPPRVDPRSLTREGVERLAADVGDERLAASTVYAANPAYRHSFAETVAVVLADHGLAAAEYGFEEEV
jgi:hypothetical protein